MVKVPDQRLTANFSLHEMLASQAAVRNNYTEQFQPPLDVIESLRQLCQHVLEPLRMSLNKPVIVTSGYRCPRLNAKIGGSKTSQHMQGEAADIYVPGMSAEELFQYIRARKLPFDQLIQEFDDWVHVSYSSEKKQQVLRAVKSVKGKTQYLTA